MDEIRAQSVEGCLRLVRGGLEIGGILFGTRQGDSTAILAFRSTPIVYALGPTFLLSEQDRRTFAEVLRSHESDPDLKGMVAVGWFVSHSRGESVAFTDNDAAIFDEFFPEPFHTTLVLRPERSGRARAAFFTRDADGRVQRGRSDSEFELTPLGGSARESTEPPEQPVPPPEFTSVIATRTVRPRGYLALAVSAAAFLLGAGVAAAYFLLVAKPPPPPLGLTVNEEGQALLLAWNPTALSDGESATIEVKSAGNSHLVHISRPQLARGAYPLPNTGNDMSLRMTTYQKNGSILTQDSARYVAPVARPSSETIAAREQAVRLRAEKAKLESALNKQTARAKALEERSRVLERILRSEQQVKGAAK
jgi:hypothetical protein